MARSKSTRWYAALVVLLAFVLLAWLLGAVLTLTDGERVALRVGLVVLGINPSSPEPIGAVSVDEHRPGLHLVLGDPQSKITGAGWSARTSFAACQGSSTVQIDGQLIVDDGRLLLA